jgi:hypothetical protein
MRHLLILILFAPICIFSQELKFSASYGYTIGKTVELKKVMLHTDVQIGFETKQKKNFSFNISAGISALKFSYSDVNTDNIFNSKYFICMPFSIKRYLTISPKNYCYIEAGAFGNYYFLDKKEKTNQSTTSVQKQTDIGSNFGLLFSIGYKKLLSSKLAFEIKVLGQTDYLFAYKNRLNKIETDRRMLVLSFSKKFK